MSSYRRSIALTLRRENIGEYDRRYTFYTKRYGKVVAIGRGTHKILSKLAGTLEPYRVIEINLASGKTNNTIIAAETINGRNGLWSGETTLVQAAFISEIVDTLIQPEQADKNVWQLITQVYGELYKPSMVSNILGSFFIVRLLTILGFGPELHNCINCHQRLKSEPATMVISRGLACQQCKIRGIRITTNVIKIIRLMQRGNWPLVKKLSASNEDITLLSSVTYKLLGQHLAKPPATLKLLNYLARRVNG
ncbi:DNA repair protein RecO [Patescibacteria group bacterium]